MIGTLDTGALKLILLRKVRLRPKLWVFNAGTRNIMFNPSSYNISAIILMTKGKSTSQRTKPERDIFLSWIKSFVHMGTKTMIVDFHTKPLQGDDLFGCRDKIMGG